jgi:hypothetical protein
MKGTAWLWNSPASHPRTSTTCPRRVRADRGRNKIWPSARGHLWESTAGGDAQAYPPRSSYSESARPPCSTSTRPRDPPPTQDGTRQGESVGCGVIFRSYKGSGEVIQRFARCHFTPRRRESVARMVSPETCRFALFLPRRQPRRPSRASRGSSPGQTLSENDAAAPSKPRRFPRRRHRGF